MARYYSNRYGKFMTPDKFADQTDPQSWNRYLYTQNDSINFIDPDGLCWIAMTPFATPDRAEFLTISSVLPKLGLVPRCGFLD
jgi:hypothetical protein